MRHRGVAGCFSAIEVADHRRGHVAAGSERRAIGRKAPAERAHHAPDMLADDDVANPRLPQLAIHILDEHLGEQRHRRSLFWQCIEPLDRQRQ